MHGSTDPSGRSAHTESGSLRLRYSLVVFAGGACYGIIGSVVKLAYGDGYSFPQVTCTQTVFALATFLLLALIDRLRGFRRMRLSWKQRAQLAAMGLVSAGTTTFYYLSLSLLPASVAIALLFQFTWMGLVFEVACTRKRPHAASFASVAVILAGTVFASGLAEGTLESLNPLGILCGLVAAVCCASFMFLSGRVVTDAPVQQRGLWASVGYFAAGMAVCPDYFASGALTSGLWSYGLVLGPLSFVLPMILFGIGCARISPGLSTIMASSELPISVACAVLILHEAVTPLQLMGTAIILLGVAIAQLPSFSGMRRKGKRKAPPA